MAAPFTDHTASLSGVRGVRGYGKKAKQQRARARYNTLPEEFRTAKFLKKMAKLKLTIPFRMPASIVDETVRPLLRLPLKEGIAIIKKKFMGGKFMKKFMRQP